MAKLLINYDATSTNEHWGLFNEIGMDDIKEKFKDAKENDIKKIITSVPSPFAQLHLYDAVFGMVAENPNGNTIYHRLVSKCLDILEITFNYYTLKDQGIKIAKWDKAQQLKKLKESTNEGQRLLGETLELYSSAGKALAKDTNIFMILFESTVIGGTSIFTLLFPAADSKKLNIANANGHFYFDEETAQPLHEREHEFQLFLHKIFLAHSFLRENCTNLNKYLEKQSQFINDRIFKKEVQDLTRQGSSYHSKMLYNDYDILRYNGKEAVVIYGDIDIPIRKKDDVNVKEQSDFVIKYNEKINIPNPEQPPLVLQQGFGKANMKYLKGEWKSTYEVPFYNENTPLKDRILPVIAEQYPFLTIDDFLEGSLIALPYNVHKSRFHFGKIEYETGVESTLGKYKKFNYLAPIKKIFFDYFLPEDIEKMLTVTIIGDKKVKVSLAIPIKKGEIIFEKYYYQNPQKDEYGSIIEINMNLAVFPFYKFEGEENSNFNDFYKIMLMDNDSKNNGKSFSLDFYCHKIDENNKETNQYKIPKEKSKSREDREIKPYGEYANVFEDDRNIKTKGVTGTTFFQVNGTIWDYCEIVHIHEGKKHKNLIVPTWEKVQNGTKKFQFGIDFGTTNTYVAYTEGNDRTPKTFAITSNDMQMIMLNEPDNTQQDSKAKYAAKNIFQEIGSGAGRYYFLPVTQFIPTIINEKDLPIRTAILQNTNNKGSALVFSTTSIMFNPYVLKREAEIEGNSTVFDVKWSGAVSRQNLSIYFEEWLRLIRNKVIQNGGNLNEVSIFWTVPLSMSQRTIENFVSLWQSNFHQIFRTDRATYCLTEAYAPYRYLLSSGLVPNQDLCTIDIGGGTTDIMFRLDGKLAYNTSFRFAGDVLWDEAFNEASQKDNPFLKGFKQILDASSNENPDFREAKDIFNEYYNNPERRSSDIIALSFKYDRELKIINYLEDAKNLRVLFLIHYTSIVYHVAEIIKSEGSKIPRYFIFTGMGSKYIQLLDRMGNTLTKITKTILQLKKQKVPDNFELRFIEQPKEATAKGTALYQYVPNNPEGILYEGDVRKEQNIKYVHLLGTSQKEGQSVLNEKTNMKYLDITDGIQDAVAENVIDFIEAIFLNEEILKELSNLGIETDIPHLISLWKDKNKTDGIKKGLYLVNPNDLNKDQYINETLFFYQVKEKIYETGKAIFDKYGK